MRSILAGALLVSLVSPSLAWRSTLYPTGWAPPAQDSFYTDKFLQDFSYAGYHNGDKPIPTVAGPIVDVVKAFQADSSGKTDATAAIQKSIDSVGKLGGGVVYLPAGTYRLTTGASGALRITKSRTVLRGAGIGKTFLLNTNTDMRDRKVISVSATGGSWTSIPSSSKVLIAKDLPSPTRTIPVADVAPFQVGDWVVVRQIMTEAWIAEHKETDWTGYASNFTGPAYYRQILSIDAKAGTLGIDVPTRYALLRRDSAMVYPAPPMLEEVGIERLSIGNVQHTGTGWAEEDYNDPANGSCDTHNSYLILFSRVRNGWIRKVDTYQPAGNTTTAHLLSNGILLNSTRGVTIDSCHFQRPQFGGGGGNGYMYRVTGNENLIKDSRATHSRHGFVLSHMLASGNVFLRAYDKDGGRQSGSVGSERTSGKGNDHHMHFSHSNLFDNCTAENSNYQAAYRPYGSVPKHNLTAAHSVYWNTQGLGTDPWVIHTQQSRFGYAIGTRGTVTEVRTAEASTGSAAKTDPPDFVEGKALGTTLEPASLYEDQLLRRKARETTSVGPRALEATDAPSPVRFDGRGIVLGGHRADGTRAEP